MNKIFRIALSALIGFMTLFSCNDTPKEAYAHNLCITYYLCYYQETCSLRNKYMTINSVQITSNYSTDIKTENGSGYYVLFGADTNLTYDDFSNDENELFLSYKYKYDIPLNFLLYDDDNDLIVYEFEQKESVDFSQFLTLKPQKNEGHSEYKIFIQYKVFNGYFTENGEDYGGKEIYIYLDW